MAGLTEIIDDTITVLEEMKRAGVTHLVVSRSTLAELGRPAVFRQPATPIPAGDLRSGNRRGRETGAEPESGTEREGFGNQERPVHMVAETVASPLAGSKLGAPLVDLKPTVRAADRGPALAQLEQTALACIKCNELSRCRHNVVFGVGNPHADLMFIGEAPGHDEDAQGEPFVGKAGQLLTKIIGAMGLARNEVYICNVLKCRPPENRVPLPDEIHNCLPFLLSQIDLIKPKVIVGLGATAMRALLDVQLGITRMRGHWYTFRGVPIMPTFHPAYLLRNPAAKREVWEDMQDVVVKLGRKLPEASRKSSRA